MECTRPHVQCPYKKSSIWISKNTGKLWKFEREKKTVWTCSLWLCECGAVVAIFSHIFASASFFSGQNFLLLYVSYVDPVKYALVGYFFLVFPTPEIRIRWVSVWCVLCATGRTHKNIDENMMNKQIRIDSNRIQNNNRNEINADRLSARACVYEWTVWWKCLYLNGAHCKHFWVYDEWRSDGSERDCIKRKIKG